MASYQHHNEEDPDNKGLSKVNTTAGLIKSLSGRVTEKYASGILTFVIAAALPLVEEFFVEARYRCPCRTEEECNEGETMRLYTGFTLAFTSIVIFVLGFLASATIKCVCKNERRSKENGSPEAEAGEIPQHENPDGQGVDESPSEDPESCKLCKPCKYGLTCGDFWFWTVQAFVISLTWLCILAIDGDYFACARECIAYNGTCAEIAKIPDGGEFPFTVAYRRAKRTSQWVGYVSTLLPLSLYVVTNFTKFDCECCQKTCCYCCCCKFDKSLSLKEEREFDEATKKANRELKEILMKKYLAAFKKRSRKARATEGAVGRQKNIAMTRGSPPVPKKPAVVKETRDRTGAVHIPMSAQTSRSGNEQELRQA